MNIIFNNAISNIIVLNNFKRKIGTKYLVIPIYEIVPNAVIDEHAGFSGEYYCTVEEFNQTSEKSYIEDNKIYYKPHCTIFFGMKGYQDVYFKTVEELNNYVEDLKKLGSHIIIE